MQRKVLITGGAKRVGYSLSNYFAGIGYDVLIHVNNSMAVGEGLVAELQKKYPGQNFSLIKHDFKEWRSLNDFINKVFEKFGLPDVIIHNASYYLSGNLASTQADDMENMMGIHLFSPMIIDKAYRQHNGKGNIISILDTAITSNHSSHAMYLLAKKSLAEYTKMAALEWAPDIRVNGLALGPVLPPEGKSDEFFRSVVEKTPLQKQIDLSSIAQSIDFILGNKNITGQIINCDSGQHLL
ncbi:SDR family oxidoreductase [Carboxylicivirga marina]|uniref:SDR family oxidoreductase n=1 Tax=Carboxylicivirga marina TaxID=2800988 RepID=UPI0025995E19|nr:SDR family oxidoreductase [uncultured Carboxylicivirga sp.]